MNGRSIWTMQPAPSPCPKEPISNIRIKKMRMVTVGEGEGEEGQESFKNKLLTKSFEEGVRWLERMRRGS
jgi:hypothetical protein